MIERFALHSHYESGGQESLPQGWSAVIQSTTMTVPLTLFPLFYGWLFHIQVVQSGHLLAACCVIVASGMGHLVLYGVKNRFSGLRAKIAPLNSQPSLWRGLGMEGIYAVVHFSTIVMTYLFVLKMYSHRSVTKHRNFDACIRINVAPRSYNVHLSEVSRFVDQQNDNWAERCR